MAAVDELSQLKRLILGQEQQSLERLQERVEGRTTRAQDVAEVLAESFELQQDNTDRLSMAMRAPVQQCISDTVREDPKEFADALFPIIGPAIRRAVSESIAALSEKINRALERSFSIQGIKWRIESARTGVPVSQIILRDTFIYRVEEAFVIQRDSGLMVSHVSRSDFSSQDSDAVSAMLTAIQDFVRDSFSSEEGSELDTIRVGEQVVWIFQGPEFTTAALIAGQPPREMRGIFQEVTESIHREYGDAIKTFSGAESTVTPLSDGIRVLLQPLLESESAKPHHSSRGASKPSPLIIVLFILAIFVIGWLAFRFFENERLDRLAETISATPGMELLSIERGNPVILRGLRDPLARNFPELLKENDFSAEDIQFDFIPFQSLESEIVIKRLAGLFEPPDNVQMNIHNGILSVSGSAPASYINRLQGFPLTVFGISEIDTSQLNAPNTDVVSLLRSELQTPDTVSMRYEDGIVLSEGQAPFSWLLRAREHRSEIPLVERLDLSNVSAVPGSVEAYLISTTNAPELVELKLEGRKLVVEGGGPFAWQQALSESATATGVVDGVDFTKFVPSEVEELTALMKHISDKKFYFLRSDQLTAGSIAELNRLKPDLQRLIELERLLPKHRLEFLVSGFADAAGTPEQHEAVRVKRVARLVSFLADNGVSSGQLSRVSGQAEPATDESQQWRRGEIAVRVYQDE